MSYLKTLNSNDVIVVPFTVNKSFTFEGSSSLEEANVSIDRFLGKNLTGSFTLEDPTTGYIYPQYQRLVYSSIKELYYSNYLSSSLGDGPNLPELIPGVTPDGDDYTGGVSSKGRYFNYPQTTLSYNKYFPTSSEGIIGVISIPSKLYGENIKPNSFRIQTEEGLIIDDGEGNLLWNGSSNCGNIVYSHGLAIITGFFIEGYGYEIYGESLYGGDDDVWTNEASKITNIISSSEFTCSFSSSFTLYETQYKCTLRANEFNYSLNPSLLEGDDSYKNFTTGSNFSPYITAVGLYNEQQELLAVAKLSQPLPTSQTTDTTILINIDR